eukprot:Skav206760  [mRNA]  locus=scaffold167:339818:346361:- [translate_table: standard]
MSYLAEAFAAAAAFLATFELLDVIKTTKRGADESKTSDQLRGDWELLWTSSDQKSASPIWQDNLIQTEGIARNLEFTAIGRNTVDASIAPLGPDQREEFVSRLDDFLLFKQGATENPGGSYLPQADGLEKTTVGVCFKVFTPGHLRKAKGPKGDRGNLFVLRKGHASVVQLLMENKADVNHSFDEGNQRRLTAFELAERAGHTKIATMLSESL